MKVWILVFILGFVGCIGNPKPHPDPEPIFRSYVLDELTIEVQSINGLAFDTMQLDIFKSRCQEYSICKSTNIHFIVKPSITSTKKSWSYSDIEVFRKKYRTLFDKDSKDRKVIVFLAHLQGNYSQPGMEGVAGVAVRNDFVVYFNRFSARAQAPILIHEFGHLLGLVDRTQREGDPSNPDREDHCNTVSCVMFWIANNGARFDGLCQRDIKGMLINAPRQELVMANYFCQLEGCKVR